MQDYTLTVYCILHETVKAKTAVVFYKRQKYYAGNGLDRSGNNLNTGFHGTNKNGGVCSRRFLWRL
jgi:hypothetical protein